MKRNHPPDEPEALFEEQKIVDDRLNQLFLCEQTHRVVHTYKGVWCPEQRAVCLDTLNTHPYDNLKFHLNGSGYLGPLEALYFMETNQLIVHFNNFPLSLPEAYHILLKDKTDLRKYITFYHLNRNGYICLPPQSSAKQDQILGKNDDMPAESDSPCDSSRNVTLEPIFKIDTISLPFQTVLERLRQLGPQEMKLTNEQDQQQLTITFDVYRRKTFTKNKPRKGQVGQPDYHMIVCDKSTSYPPSPAEFLALDQYDENLVKKLVFAIVDLEGSISFSQFNGASSSDLTLPSNQWPEEQPTTI